MPLSSLGDLAVELAGRHWYVTPDTDSVCDNFALKVRRLVFIFVPNPWTLDTEVKVAFPGSSLRQDE
jgi:hypothetical protein